MGTKAGKVVFVLYCQWNSKTSAILRVDTGGFENMHYAKVKKKKAVYLTTTKNLQNAKKDYIIWKFDWHNIFCFYTNR